MSSDTAWFWFTIAWYVTIFGIANWAKPDGNWWLRWAWVVAATFAITVTLRASWGT